MIKKYISAITLLGLFINVSHAQEKPVMYHIIMYGQSLMLGTSSVPLLTTQQKFNTLMFKGGIRSGYDQPLGTFYDGLAPLVEKISISPAGGARLAETPASGFSETFIDLLIKENKFSYNADEKKFEKRDITLLISSPAQGSTSVQSLTTDGTYLERFKKDIVEGQKQAIAMGKVYNVPCILWNQGERDIDLRTPSDVYKNELIAFQQLADIFIKSVTGQSNTVKLILYQTVSHLVRKTKNYIQIANAQYELAKSNPNITMSNTTYQLPFYTDHVHLSNSGSKWNGANHGIAAKRMIVDGADWRPIYVKEISYKNKEVLLQFHVPVPPLLFDEKNVSNPGNYGFSVVDEKEKPVAIHNVSLLKNNQVKIMLTEKVKPGYAIWYGNNGTTTGPENGARGNLRDSQGNVVQLEIKGKQIRLDNWTPIFKEVIH
ncbi:hypothetical protein HDC92_004899 [Pedobacter sp. AK017]|uniref:sialate O-acetylesterase n=1 Tax=Pedobacter sp. AK017 TaxID=2723073 RepID=UPI0016183EBB|nr:sialate O-acetylesterase [Pedobacter sp. AK017]MBB5441192.1 hypothetical protein [Pedobacter sp. AK017]